MHISIKAKLFKTILYIYQVQRFHTLFFSLLTRITPTFYDYVKMKCPINFIFTGLSLGPLAATSFRI